MKPINLIVAIDNKFGISRKGKIPWFIKNDLLKFKQITTGQKVYNCLIYGKQTFFDLGKPLPNRHNMVITSSEDIPNLSNLSTHKSIQEALTAAELNDNINEIFICGGSRIYDESIRTLDIDKYYITKINGDHDCDNFFPYRLIDMNNYSLVESKKDKICEYNIYKKN